MPFIKMQTTNKHYVLSVLLVAIITLSACTTPANIKATDLRAFSSDGCSYYPDGTNRAPTQWEACCIAHDKAYWQGGVRAKRSQADANLRQCVIDHQGGKWRAQMMWLGVRLGGSPIFPTSFRWAFGWPYYRGYSKITAEEQGVIDGMMKGGD